MKLATFRAPDRSGPLAGLVDGDRVTRSAAPAASARSSPAAPPPRRRLWALAEVELLAPVLEPGTIYAIGLNYAQHVEEIGGEPPEQPLVFVKVAARSPRPAARSATPRWSGAWTTRASW